MEKGQSQALSEDYYLANFHRLATFVVETYRDILTPAECRWYGSLQSSSVSAQRLYIRLLTRKGSVFRLSKLNYPEIDDLAAAAQELAECSLAETAAPSNLGDLLAAFTKPELMKYLPNAGKRSLARVNLVEELLAADEISKAHSTEVLQQADEWITVYGHQHWTVFRLGFFGNLYQDSSEFVLEELGTVQYENYTLDTLVRPFATRAQLDAHLRYFECEALLETINIKEVSQLLGLVALIPDVIEGDDHLQRRVDRFRNRVARQLERLNCASDALALYADSVHPPARERQVRLYLSQDEREKASQLLNAMQERPFNDAEAQVAERLVQQLNKAYGRKVKPLQKFRPQNTNLTLQASNERVEVAARDFYSRLGVCHYTENVLVNSVLGLFIWDIIYHPVAGAFFNPFQSAPTDFYQASFSSRRAGLLMSRFEEIEQVEQFRERVMTAYVQHEGKNNPLVRWAHLSPELLALALERVPCDHWRLMFQRMLSDIRDNTAGFPDLILFRDSGDYEFIEIKGPGDTLQQNQLRWMAYFSEHGIPCRVVNVRWALNSD